LLAEILEYLEMFYLECPVCKMLFRVIYDNFRKLQRKNYNLLLDKRSGLWCRYLTWFRGWIDRSLWADICTRKSWNGIVETGWKGIKNLGRGRRAYLDA